MTAYWTLIIWLSGFWGGIAGAVLFAFIGLKCGWMTIGGDDGRTTGTR